MGKLFAENSGHQQRHTSSQQQDGPSWKRIVLTICFSVSVFGFVVYYVVRHWEEFTRLFSVCFGHLWVVGIASVLFLLILGLIGFQSDYLLRCFGVNLTVGEWFGLSVAANFYNLIMPFRGGMALRAFYLKKRHGLAYTQFASVQSAYQVIVIFSAGVAGIVSLSMIGRGAGAYQWPVMFFLAAVELASVAFLVFSPRFSITKGKWWKRLAGINDGWNLIKGDRMRVLVLLGISLSRQLLKACFFLLIYYCFGMMLGFWEALFISSIGMFSLMISVLPGNLGLDDAVNVISAGVIGIPLDVAIAAALLMRMVNFGVSVVLGPLFSFRLRGK